MNRKRKGMKLEAIINILDNQKKRQKILTTWRWDSNMDTLAWTFLRSLIACRGVMICRPYSLQSGVWSELSTVWSNLRLSFYMVCKLYPTFGLCHVQYYKYKTTSWFYMKNGLQKHDTYCFSPLLSVVWLDQLFCVFTFTNHQLSSHFTSPT